MFFININELLIEEQLSTLIVRRKNLYCGKLKKRPGGGADAVPRQVKKTKHTKYIMVIHVFVAGNKEKNERPSR
jgi:hypothetical protein